MSRMDSKIPPGAIVTTIGRQVAFYQTDAMGVVHHANYIHFLEDVRVAWLQEHDRPYTEWMAAERHFAVTRVEVEYLLPARAYDRLSIIAALSWVGGASAGFDYDIRREGELIATATTEHAMVNNQGKIRRIPREWRESLLRLSPQGPT
jgi:acyl-CoA thioester hydrolase